MSAFDDTFFRERVQIAAATVERDVQCLCQLLQRNGAVVVQELCYAVSALHRQQRRVFQFDQRFRVGKLFHRTSPMWQSGSSDLMSFLERL